MPLLFYIFAFSAGIAYTCAALMFLDAVLFFFLASLKELVLWRKLFGVLPLGVALLAYQWAQLHGGHFFLQLVFGDQPLLGQRLFFFMRPHFYLDADLRPLLFMTIGVLLMTPVPFLTFVKRWKRNRVKSKEKKVGKR